MFKLRNFTLLSTELVHFKFDACYIKKVGKEAKTAEKAIHLEKIQLGEYLATN